jgi:hypothetical protein
MANFGLGLAQGFELGTRMQEAYRKRRMREEFEAAQADKQRPKYTPEQGAQMRAEAGTVEQPGEYEYTIEPGSTTYTRRRRGLSAEDEAQLLAAEAARDQQGRPYYSVTRGPEGATVRGLTPTEGGGFNTIGPDTSDPRDVLNYPYISNAERLNYIGEGGYTGPQSDMRRLQSEAIAAREEEMLRPARFPVGVIPGSESTVSPGATQYLDQTYGAEGLTPTQQRAALMNRYADIISKYESPVEGERFRSLARAEERAEETYGLTKQMAKLGLSKAEREERIAVETENVYKAAGEFQEKNPGATIQQVFDHVRNTVKPSAAVLNKIIAEQVGVEENELKAFNIEVEKIIKKAGGNVDTLIEQYNTNPLLDPTTNLVKRKGKDGRVALDFVSAEDPSRVLSSHTFRNDTEARDFLVNSARNPVTAGEMLLKSRYVESQIEANMGLADYRRMRGARGVGGGGGFRAGAVQPFIDKDGNTVLLDVSKLPQRDGVIQLPEGLKSAKVKPSLSAEDKAKEKRLTKMLDSDEWQNAKTPAQQIKVMRKFGITPADMGREDTGLSDW